MGQDFAVGPTGLLGIYNLATETQFWCFEDNILPLLSFQIINSKNWEMSWGNELKKLSQTKL